MNPKEIKRLMELMSKGVDKLTEAEKSELQSLQAKANALKEEGAAGGGSGSGNDDDGLSAEDVKKLVTDGVTAALKDNKSLTQEQVQGIVETAVKGIKLPEGTKIDQKALVTEVVNEVKGLIKPGISADDVKGIVEGALKNFRPQSKMQHNDDGSGNDPEIDFPISHRSGNLAVDAKQLLNVMLKGAEAINADIPESVLRDATRRGEANEKRMIGNLRRGGVNAALGMKAITTTGAGTGAEFMNSTLSSTLISRMYLESLLAAALTSSEVQMPTNPYTFPLSTTLPEFKTGAELEDPSDSQGGTGELILNAKKLIGRVPYSYEADEDSIIAILPLILQQLGEAAAQAIEDAVINGDTAATHQDSDTHAVTKHAAKLFDGIRKLTLAQADLKISLATGGISAANIGVLRKALKRWGLNPKNLLIVAGVNGYNDLVLLPETLTADKVGSANTARIISGLAPSIYGIDIIPSAKVREDLNASGVYDGTTTTKGSFFIIHKPSWIMGVRRGFMVEQDKDISAQKKYVVASFRRAFKPVEGLNNTKAAVLGYNFNA